MCVVHSLVNWLGVTTMRCSTEIESGVKRVSGGVRVLTDWTHRQASGHTLCVLLRQFLPTLVCTSPPPPPTHSLFIRLLRRLRASCRSTRQQWMKSTPRRAANTTQTQTVRGGTGGGVGGLWQCGCWRRWCPYCGCWLWGGGWRCARGGGVLHEVRLASQGAWEGR